MDFKRHLNLYPWMLAAALACSPVMCSCDDDYDYAKKEPSSDILGASIYDYLKEDGRFTNFLRLIDDLDYRETMERTGSKTVFAARDDAFDRFFAGNQFGVTCYEELSVAQKKLLLNQAIVNMAYLSEMLPNIGGQTGPTEGVALRRTTQSVYYDSVKVVNDASLFANDNGYWKRFADKGGITLVEDAPMIVQFTPAVMSSRNISAADFSLLNNGTQYDDTADGGDIFINGVKVIERDRICKNGYVHVLAEVLTPLRTMASAIETDANSSIFAKILSRFCAPYYDAQATEDIRRNFTGVSPNYPAMQVDSVFRKGYFNRLTYTTGPKGERLGENVLRFDPNDVSYSASDVLTDMGVMFVPTDEAMRKYYDSPEGQFLKSNYPTWDDVPTALVAKFIQNHQKNSFLTSLPHDWDSMNDEKSFPMNIKVEDVDHVELCSNGVVYFLKRVIPPVDFRATYAPTLVSDNASVMKWALLDGEDLSDANGMRFFMYLYSMENMYNLIVPTDEALSEYRDPITWGNAENTAAREIWNFYYDENRQVVNARVYGVTPEGTKDLDQLKRTVTDVDIIRSRFKDILDMHTVVGSFEGGVMGGFLNQGNPGSYVVSKGGAAISLDGTGGSLTLNGMGDIELNMPRAAVEHRTDGTPFIFDNDNGRTYFIDHVLHDASHTVYDVLGSTPEFKAFRDLCMIPSDISMGFTENDDIPMIFERRTEGTKSVGTVVSFFNNYRYTIFVPTEQAINEAFAADPDLYTWDEIRATTDMNLRKERTRRLLKFIRYHFVDNSVFINGLSSAPSEYLTSARTEYNTFHSLMISRTPTSLTVTDENGNSQNIPLGATTNIPAREILYHDKGSVDKYIDASSRAVIHSVNHALTFKK